MYLNIYWLTLLHWHIQWAIILNCQVYFMTPRPKNRWYSFWCRYYQMLASRCKDEKKRKKPIAAEAEYGSLSASPLLLNSTSLVSDLSHLPGITCWHFEAGTESREMEPFPRHLCSQNNYRTKCEKNASWGQESIPLPKSINLIFSVHILVGQLLLFEL